MHFLAILSTILAPLLLVPTCAQQLSSLPACVSTCLHNALPRCSGLPCYCPALNTTTLISIASCYHSLCDPTQAEPFDAFIADVGPLCFAANYPIHHDQVQKALQELSSTTFETKLSWSSIPAAPISLSGAGNGEQAVTGVPATTTGSMVIASGSPMAGVSSSASAVVLISGSGMMPSQTIAPVATVASASSSGKAMSGNDGGNLAGAVAGVVIAMAGFLLDVAG